MKMLIKIINCHFIPKSKAFPKMNKTSVGNDEEKDSRAQLVVIKIDTISVESGKAIP